MKKVIKNWFVVLFFVQMSYAQSVQFGIKAGANYANVTGSKINTNAIVNYHAGIVAKIGLTKGLSFQPELLYTTQGASYETALADYKNELGYIVIPAMLQIHLSKSITLDMGPQVGFLLNEKNNFDVQKPNTFDASANAGLGLKITNSIFAQTRYCLGLTKLQPNSDIKNNVVQLSLGILF
jgi:Outer membrane protein beta-barrel domain